ncbi:MAG: glutamine--tRNA ligase/YqeY domain fusion protein [Bacteroidetes bacterium]|nr:glutamine--tRNA ligase/YqeY domain fusion protein [Bacteroidota bacterium]
MSEEKSNNFIEEIVEQDLKEGKYKRILTRFPPEPNGYLHIGHAKSICLNFGLTMKYNGDTNLRFDDTNPVTEDTEYVESIKEDIRWLGFSWINEFYASDYFERLHEFAIELIKKGLAYVDDSTSEQIALEKGSHTTPGIENKYRSRSVEENLQLFAGMKNGQFKEGEKVLRAKINMASTNMHMRDPVMYRIKYAYHHRTGDKWCIYPLYDFAHGQSDSIEKITHSVCTLEFVPHRELYDWYIKELGIFPSHQYEFARLNMTYTVMSKRKLLQLVNEQFVSGWDDPRMPTISGLRRKGYTPSSIRLFCEKIGIARRDNLIDISLLEFCIREELNTTANRRMAVINPVKLIIENYEDGRSERVTLENLPNEPENVREVSFGREIYIEREDFMEIPVKKWFRLAPGQMVRLKGAYIIKCERIEKDQSGEVSCIYCSYFPESKSGHDTSNMKVKGVIHWVHALDCVPAEFRLYSHLFKSENPALESGDFKDDINPDSLIVKRGVIENGMKTSPYGNHFQFLRNGYFCVDKDSKAENLVFNRTVGLKDSFVPQKKN